MITNIMITGVGGQGLVLATKLLSETAFLEGYDLRTSDVIGLSQRGGKVFGSVRFGDHVYSPTIPSGQIDYLVAMESLEGLRMINELRKGASVVLNQFRIYPNRTLLEKEDYPDNIEQQFSETAVTCYPVNTIELLGQNGIQNTNVVNVVLLGKLSTLLPFQQTSWLTALERFVPKKALEMNRTAFAAGRNT